MFTSYEFIIFVTLCFVVYYLIPKKTQPYMLLIVSYMIYFSLNGWYPVYLLVTTVTVYLAGRYIADVQEKSSAYITEHKRDMSRDEKKSYKAAAKKKMKRVLLV